MSESSSVVDRRVFKLLRCKFVFHQEPESDLSVLNAIWGRRFFEAVQRNSMIGQSTMNALTVSNVLSYSLKMSVNNKIKGSGSIVSVFRIVVKTRGGSIMMFLERSLLELLSGAVRVWMSSILVAFFSCIHLGMLMSTFWNNDSV